VTRSSGSWVRRSRPALARDRFCADRDPRFAVFPLRPSSDRATDRRSSLAVQPSTGFRPGRLARLHGRLSWVFWPPSLHAFSAQRPGTFAGRRLHARGVSSMRAIACQRLLPGGLPAVGDGRLRATSLALFVRAAEVACAWRSRVCFAVGGRFLFRSRDPLPRFLVRRRTARQETPYARRDLEASGSHVVHNCRHARLHFLVARLGRDPEASKVFHTAIHSLWKRGDGASDDGHSAQRARANPRRTPLSAIQRGAPANGADFRDRHRGQPRATRASAIDARQPAPQAAARHRWTCAAIGLIVRACRFPSTRSCRAPRK
jgi:hypothetical protein